MKMKLLIILNIIVLCDLAWQVETMFEKYNFAGVFIQIQAVLTLYAQGAYRDEWRLMFCFSL